VIRATIATVITSSRFPDARSTISSNSAGAPSGYWQELFSMHHLMVQRAHEPPVRCATSGRHASLA
jgi:hypothetical protein